MNNEVDILRLDGRESYDLIAPVDTLVRDYRDTASRERPDLIEHAHRVLGLVRAFAGDKIPDSYDAIMMHDIVSRFRNSDEKYSQESRDSAGLTLFRYFTNPQISHEKAKYMRDVLSDFDEIEVAAGQHRRELAAEAVDGESHLSDERCQLIVDIVSNRYEGRIPDEVWGISEARIDPEYMKRFLQTVNIESVIIKACELLDNLHYPVSGRESAVLQDVLEAESFYAPLCEVLGLEALGSNLLGQTKLIRHEKLQHYGAIARVGETISNIKMIGYDTILRDVFDRSNSDASNPKYDMSLVVKPDNNGEHPVHVGEFVYQKDNGDLVMGNLRIKSIGSAVDKMIRCDGEMPMDMVGFMAISNDLQSSASDFADFIKDLTDRSHQPSSGIKLQKSHGKESAIYVQGTTEYVDTMKNALADAGIDESQIQVKVQSESDIEKRGYEKMKVSKATFIRMYDHKYEPGKTINVPVEVQFLTRVERRRSRIGDIAHIVYKHIDTRLKKEHYDELPDDSAKKQELKEWARKTRKLFVGVLGDIYERMSRLSPNSYDTNGQSDDGGELLFGEIEQFLTEHSVS